MSFSLSSRGLGNVNYEYHKNDFTFTFVNKSFKCPLLVAEFLSPKVAKLRKSDSSLRELSFDAKINNEETIDRIKKLIHGETIQVQNEEDEIIQILIQIGNNEILSSHVSSKLTLDNSLKQLELKRSHGIDFSKEIEFCASNFESLKKNDFSPEILSFVLDSPFLKLSNEGSLLTSVSELMKIDKSYSPLLRFIKCEYLLAEEIELYVSFLDSLDPESIGFIWPSLRLRFLKSYYPPDFNRHKSNKLRDDKNTQICNTQEIDSLKQQLSDKSSEIANLQNDNANLMNQTIKEKDQAIKDKDNELSEKNQLLNGGRFSGLIKSLSNQIGGDLVDRGIVRIEASSNSGNLKCILQENTSYWRSSGETNPWVKFEFVGKKVLLSAYSLEICYLISFKLEGSNDGSNWTLVDSRDDVPTFTLNSGHWRGESFTVTTKTPFRFFRIMQVKSNQNFFSLMKFEFFGSIT